MAGKRKGSGKQMDPGSVPEMTGIAKQGTLFDRVVAILEQARASVVRAVNTHMVTAYWLIGREIVEEIQGGEKRAAYGQQVLSSLSKQLTARYGEGFSVTGLQDFRKFYFIYSHRSVEIQHPMGVKSGYLPMIESDSLVPAAGERLQSERSLVPANDPSSSDAPLTGFHPQLSWSHFRALMRVEKTEAREFYEREALAGGWDKRTLERQIHSYYYERLLKSQHASEMRADGRRSLTSRDPAIDSLKHPYVLEFLDIPRDPGLQERDLETRILSALQSFLLELGHGFAFVARQKRLSLESDNRYVDLVFYHIQLRFYLLIDLKIGKLTHGDVGQMDGYVRMFDALYAKEGDNPSIGLILCTEKDEVVARYSVLNDRTQIFAAKYMLYLPTEEELQREIERERRLIEASLESPEPPIRNQRRRRP